jgi:glycosyltransferase involved in cell wall biosynthesis
MRTLLYFRTHFDDPANIGVIDKCKAIALGFGVDSDIWFFDQNGLQHQGPDTTPSFRGKTPKRSWRHLFLYYFAADRYLKRHIDFRQYAVLYIRHLPAHPMFLTLLKKAKQQNPSIKIIIELPTWPYDGELKGSTAQLAALVDRTYRKKMANYTDYFVHFGLETEIWGVPTLRITNGIEVAKKPLRQWKDPKDGVLRLLAVGNWNHALGVDRLLHGVSVYRKMGKKVVVRIVGQGTAIDDLKHLVQELGIEENIFFLPPCTGADYDRLFDEADIAIGKLAIPVKGLLATSSLRHRDYCARGIPFVLSEIDSDIATNWPFVLHVSNDAAPINIQEIEDFHTKIKANHPNYQKQMRDFALENLDWSGKIRQIMHQISPVNV